MMLSNENIKEIITKIEGTLKEYDYERIQVERYALLTEEALLKWQAALGDDCDVSFKIKEGKKNITFFVIVKGKKIFPFEVSGGTQLLLARMHERLLSGTGYEFAYSYFANTNKLSLSLPKRDHEKRLFYKNMWYLAIPVALQALLTTIITATDSILMGLIDQNSLSAISMTAALNDIFNIVILAFVTGVTIFCAQYWGKRDYAGINRLLKTSLKFSGAIGLLFFIPTFFMPNFVMSLYTDVPELIEKGSLYLRFVSPMFLCAAFYQIYYAIMKSTGRVRRFAVYMVLATVVDFSLNIILVFGYLGFPAMGIRGAALGTMISSILQLVLCLADLIASRQFHLFKQIAGAEWTVSSMEFLKKSASVGAQLLSWTLANNIIMSIFGHMGSDIAAASGVVNIISEIAIFACAGLYNTCGIMVGNKLGSGDLDMAKTYSLRYLRSAFAVGCLTTMGVLALNAHLSVLPFRLSKEAFVFLHTLLYVVAFELLFKALNCTMNYGGFYAGGDTVPLLIIDSVNMWLIMVPLGLLSLYALGLPPIVVAMILHFDEFTSFPFKVARYRKFKWVRKIQ